MLYSSLPEEYKTPVWFMACFLQEANQLFYSFFSISFIFQLHILLTCKLSRVLKNLAESTGRRRSIEEVNGMIGQIRLVQLVVTLFNVGHRNIIYCMKLLCISLSIVNGYGTIAHGKDNLVFLLLAACVTCDCVFFYVIVYEKAFGIPDGLERAKRVLTVEIQGIRNGRLRKVMGRELNSVPLVGLKVGDFHMLERESTPIFVDFVVRNIVNLLVLETKPGDH